MFLSTDPPSLGSPLIPPYISQASPTDRHKPEPSETKEGTLHQIVELSIVLIESFFCAPNKNPAVCPQL
jgi:hypothetical protein